MNAPARDVQVARPTMAVFDFDETLVRSKTMFDFLEHFQIEQHGPLEGPHRASAEVARLREMARHLSRPTVNREFYRLFRGQPRAAIEASAARWFAAVNRPEFYHQEVLDLYREHKAQGAQTVVLSGSAVLFLAPFAAYLGVDHLLAINLETDAGGLLTGEIDGIQTIGDGKSHGLEQLLSQMDIRPVLYGYGDHLSDFPFLTLCDHPALILSSAVEWGAHIPSTFDLITVF